MTWKNVRAEALATLAALAVITGSLLGAGAVWGQETSAPAPTTVPTVPLSSTTSSAPAPRPFIDGGTVVATTRVKKLRVFDSPGGAPLIAPLSRLTDFHAPRTLVVVGNDGYNAGWLRVLLPVRPNGSEGWIRAQDVSLSTINTAITVDLARRELVFYEAGVAVLTSIVAIGAPETPTPPGVYYVTDPVDMRHDPDTSYGAYALGISGFSEVHLTFKGGPGQLAVHGTNRPDLLGQAVSNGCIRVPDKIIMEIARRAPLGTPVIIT